MYEPCTCWLTVFEIITADKFTVQCVLDQDNLTSVIITHTHTRGLPNTHTHL